MYWVKYWVYGIYIVGHFYWPNGLCARSRDFENRLLIVVLMNFGHSLLPLIVEQTHTALR